MACGFPDIAPGNFTWSERLGRWVWTTFNAYQWDLDYTNPAVFVAMAEAMLALAEAGVDVLRLDAVPFLWKRLGTDLPLDRLDSTVSAAGLGDLMGLGPKILKGEIRGRVVVDVNK